MDSNIDTNASGFAADPQGSTNGNNTNGLDAHLSAACLQLGLHLLKHVIYGLMFDLWKL